MRSEDGKLDLHQNRFMRSLRTGPSLSMDSELCWSSYAPPLYTLSVLRCAGHVVPSIPALDPHQDHVGQTKISKCLSSNLPDGDVADDHEVSRTLSPCHGQPSFIDRGEFNDSVCTCNFAISHSLDRCC